MSKTYKGSDGFLYRLNEGKVESNKECGIKEALLFSEIDIDTFGTLIKEGLTLTEIKPNNVKRLIQSIRNCCEELVQTQDESEDIGFILVTRQGETANTVALGSGYEMYTLLSLIVAHFSHEMGIPYKELCNMLKEVPEGTINPDDSVIM